MSFMYRPDLSPYIDDEEYHLLGTLDVGWLDKTHLYPQGEVPEGFLDRLFEFCMNSVRKTRGFHKCGFCDPTPSHPICVQRGDEELWLGSAEIRVVGRGKVYAAPDLIYHYIAEHKYRPPDEFIEAVLQGPLPNSPEYKAFNFR